MWVRPNVGKWAKQSQGSAAEQTMTFNVANEDWIRQDVNKLPTRIAHTWWITFQDRLEMENVSSWWNLEWNSKWIFKVMNVKSHERKKWKGLEIIRREIERITGIGNFFFCLYNRMDGTSYWILTLNCWTEFRWPGSLKRQGSFFLPPLGLQ